MPLDAGASAPVLAYWIAQSESDSWTYDDLVRLIGVHLDSGQPMPEALEQWTREVAAGRRARPARPGRKSDRTSDVRIALTALVCKKLFGSTLEEVHKIVPQAISFDGFTSARKRGWKLLGKTV